MQTINHRKDLYKLLPLKPVTVELGVAEGLFSLDILTDWKPSKHYMVDLWGHIPNVTGDGNFPQGWHDTNYEAVKNKVKKFRNAVILKGMTVEMAAMVEDNSVDCVYVDACHIYEFVRDDIKAWWPKLKVGGVMAFHDFQNNDYGVNLAVKEFAHGSGLTLRHIPEDKAEDAGAYLIKQ